MNKILNEANISSFIRKYRKLKCVFNKSKRISIGDSDWVDTYYVKKTSNYIGNKEKYWIFRYIYGGVGIFGVIHNYIVSAQWAEENGYIPVAVFETEDALKKKILNKDKFYESVFVQYGGLSIDDIVKKGGYFVNNTNVVDKIPLSGIRSISYNESYKYDRIYWSKVGELFKKYIIFRQDVLNEYDSYITSTFLDTDNVLGVCVREGFGIANEVNIGRKRTEELRDLNPKEPKLFDILDEVEEKLKIWNCDCIYLCAQFKETIDVFRERFCNIKIYIYEREYISRTVYIQKYNKLNDDMDISTAYSMVYDSYISSKNKLIRDYLGQIYVLAHCDYLITTVSGGSRGALMINSGKYKDVFCFEPKQW